MYWLTGLLGLALGIAPFVLGYSQNTPALWTSISLGALVLVVSAYKALAGDYGRWEYWVAGIAGFLAVIAPFTLGFSALSTAMYTTVILGAALLAVAAYQLYYALPNDSDVEPK